MTRAIIITVLFILLCGLGIYSFADTETKTIQLTKDNFATLTTEVTGASVADTILQLERSTSPIIYICILILPEAVL